MIPETYWMNFYVNKSNEISMLAEDPHIIETEALEQIDDCDGYPDRTGTIWTYTHTIYMINGQIGITNMTGMVQEMKEQARLDRIHDRAVANGLREMQS